MFAALFSHWLVERQIAFFVQVVLVLGFVVHVLGIRYPSAPPNPPPSILPISISPQPCLLPHQWARHLRGCANCLHAAHAGEAHSLWNSGGQGGGDLLLEVTFRPARQGEALYETLSGEGL